jgi:threonine dehydratase
MNVDLSEWRVRIVEAGNRIYELAHPTPVTLIEDDPRIGSARAFLKLEHLQKTGSFKLRGATNKVLSLAPEEASKGVITSSTGNHALGVATAARYRGIDAEVFVCSQISAEKLHLIEASGALVRSAGNAPLEAELAARAAAVASGRTYISPYNDRDVIAGQGTIGIEVVRQVDSIDALYIAVGGGGLVGGVGAYVKSVSPRTEIVGCWPQNSRVMYECLHAGRILDFPEQPTSSESTAGGVEPGSITFDLCQQVIDRCVLVSEREILEAMRWAHQRGWKVEGAAGVAIAAFFKDASEQRARTAVIISCGGNASPEVLRRLNNPEID